MKSTLILLALGAAALLGAGPTRLQAQPIEYSGSQVPLHLSGQPRDVSRDRAERTVCARRKFELDEGTG